MKINTKRNQKRNIVIACALVLLLVCIGGLVYAYRSTIWPPGKQSSATNETSQQSTDSLTQPDVIARPNPSKSNQPDKTPAQYENEGKNNSGSGSTSDQKLSGVINYKAVTNGSLSIRTTIDQKLSTGTCTLTLTNKTTGKTVTKTADVFANPSSSTCKGFDVPTSSLSSGTWNISISVRSGSALGTITGQVSL